MAQVRALSSVPAVQASPDFPESNCNGPEAAPMHAVQFISTVLEPGGLGEETMAWRVRGGH